MARNGSILFLLMPLGWQSSAGPGSSEGLGPHQHGGLEVDAASQLGFLPAWQVAPKTLTPEMRDGPKPCCFPQFSLRSHIASPPPHYQGSQC